MLCIQMYHIDTSYNTTITHTKHYSHAKQCIHTMYCLFGQVMERVQQLQGGAPQQAGPPDDVSR